MVTNKAKINVVKKSMFYEIEMLAVRLSAAHETCFGWVATSR